MTYTPDHKQLAISRLSRSLRRMLRAYLTMPAHLDGSHDAAIQELARTLGHAAISKHRELCPEPMRY